MYNDQRVQHKMRLPHLIYQPLVERLDVVILAGHLWSFRVRRQGRGYKISILDPANVQISVQVTTRPMTIEDVGR